MTGLNAWIVVAFCMFILTMNMASLLHVDYSLASYTCDCGSIVSLLCLP